MKTKTTDRFDRAVTKLYNAFHKGELSGMDCARCAVGNICCNISEWGNYMGRWNIGDEVHHPDALKYSGYSPSELGTIESLFMYGTKDGGMNLHNNGNGGGTKEDQFKGLCAVVEYLCELDGIPNVLDFQKLFEYDKQLNPIHEL